MKKTFMALLFIICACTDATALKVGTYKMVNSPNNIPVILSFSSDGSINAKVINIIMGNYVINDNNITITPGGSTMMMGPQSEMEFEQNFIKALTDMRTYKMTEENLELIKADGSKFIFKPYKETE